jgi:hypothetical protein
MNQSYNVHGDDVGDGDDYVRTGINLTETQRGIRNIWI